MDKRIIDPYIDKFFNSEILPNLISFIRIPNCSPNYDIDWEKNGNALKAAMFLKDWVSSLELKNCFVEVLQDPPHTPFIFIEIQSNDQKLNEKTIVMYGHYDKQPGLTGWSDGLGPQTPVIKGNKLYGRGSTDDGYAIFAAIASVKAAQDNNFPLPRIIIMIEGAEESYNDDIVYYTQQLLPIIQQPSLIICLDSGCEDYERLWTITNLRGNIVIDLTVSVLKYGMHSGVAGGLVPDSFMVIRKLLDRIDNYTNGIFKPETQLEVDIPADREKQIDNVKDIMGDSYLKYVPLYKNTKTFDPDIKNLIIRNTWKPTLTITGSDGLPETYQAGNVLRSSSSLRLSIRTPPILPNGDSAKKAANRIKELLELNPPYNAKVVAKVNGGDGWNLTKESKKLENLMKISSQMFFNKDMQYFGEGGSIPFINYFNKTFPDSDLCVIGLGGPDSNVHGVDESIDLEFAKKLIKSLTYIVSAYFA